MHTWRTSIRSLCNTTKVKLADKLLISSPSKTWCLTTRNAARRVVKSGNGVALPPLPEAQKLWSRALTPIWNLLMVWWNLMTIMLIAVLSMMVKGHPDGISAVSGALYVAKCPLKNVTSGNILLNSMASAYPNMRPNMGIVKCTLSISSVPFAMPRSNITSRILVCIYTMFIICRPLTTRRLMDQFLKMRSKMEVKRSKWLLRLLWPITGSAEIISSWMTIMWRPMIILWAPLPVRRLPLLLKFPILLKKIYWIPKTNVAYLAIVNLIDGKPLLNTVVLFMAWK